MRQEDIASSTDMTKTEEAGTETKAPETSEAVETGSVSTKEEGKEGQEAKDTGYTYAITESSAPLSSQIDNTSQSKKNCYEVPEYDLAGFKTVSLGQNDQQEGSKEIENSVSAQARAKEGDTINGKELKQSDIDWAKEKTDGAFTLGDLQRGNDLPEMPEIKYTPEVKEQPEQQQQEAPAEAPTYDITNAPEGDLAQMEVVPQSPVAEIPEEGQTEQVLQEDGAGELEKEGWDGWSDSQKEAVDRVFGKDTLTPAGAALIQKLGVQDKFVNICDDFSKIAERRAVAKEVDDDLLLDALTQVHELAEGLEDPKALAFMDNMGSTFSKEASRAESEMLSDLKSKMNELFPGFSNLDRLVDALDPQDEIQAFHDGVMKLGNSGVQALYRITLANIDSTMMAADARYMTKEEQNVKLVEMAKQNADVYGEEEGKDITTNAFIGFLTGDHNLVDKAAAALGQGVWDGAIKDGIKFISYAEKIIGKRLAAKVHSIAIEGKDAVEELKNTVLDEIAHARGKAEPYINLAKGVAKCLAGFAGLVITGGASAKLMLDGANDLANLSWKWQNTKLGMQIEGMQLLLQGMEEIGFWEPQELPSNTDDVKTAPIINRGMANAVQGPGVTMGKADVTGNGSSRYERKKKSLEGLNYNTAGAQGWNEGIGSEEEAAELYKNLLRTDGAARRFAADMQEAS